MTYYRKECLATVLLTILTITISINRIYRQALLREPVSKYSLEWKSLL